MGKTIQMTTDSHHDNGDKEEAAQHFSSSKREKLWTPNSVSGKIDIQEWQDLSIFSNEEKLRDFVMKTLTYKKKKAK